jgi:hypothetical protein
MLSKPIKEYKCPKCGKITTRCLHPSKEFYLYHIKCSECKTFYWLRDENKIGEYPLPDEYIALDFDKYFNNEIYGKEITEYMSIEEYIKMTRSELFQSHAEEMLSTDEELIEVKKKILNYANGT